MTDRLKELARQAGLIAPYGREGSGLADFDWREFAKLIIDDCVSVLSTDQLGKTITAEQLIKQHFESE